MIRRPRGGEDASPPRGLKDEVGTPQTQTGAQRPAHPPDPQQAVRSPSARGARQDSGPAGVSETSEKHHVRVRGWSEPPGQDVKVSPPPLLTATVCPHCVCRTSGENL